MSQQLEFEFVKKYNIFTDEFKPVTADDLRIYNEICRAYSHVRFVAEHFRKSVEAIDVVLELDRIQADLVQRLYK